MSDLKAILGFVLMFGAAIGVVVVFSTEGETILVWAARIWLTLLCAGVFIQGTQWLFRTKGGIITEKRR